MRYAASDQEVVQKLIQTRRTFTVYFGWGRGTRPQTNGEVDVDSEDERNVKGDKSEESMCYDKNEKRTTINTLWKGGSGEG